MFVLKLALKNKMYEFKKLFQSFNIVGPLAFAVSVPWIIFKMIGAAYLKKGYNELVGKIVVITGASSGIGEALAHEFYKHGCQVVLCARRRQELERVRTDLLHTHCNVTTLPPIIIPLDLMGTKELPNHIDKILSITGKIDILINNGGAGHRGHIVDTSLDVDERLMAVNYFGAVAMTKAVLKSMIKNNQGHIVFVSSVQGLIAIPERSAYAASKHALQAFSDTLRATEIHICILLMLAEFVFFMFLNMFNTVTTASPGYVNTSFSINAITGTGKQYGVMDDTTAKGLFMPALRRCHFSFKWKQILYVTPNEIEGWVKSSSTCANYEILKCAILQIRTGPPKGVTPFHRTGFSPEYVAEQIVRAVVTKNKEIVIAPLLPKIGIFLRHFVPVLYFYLMEKRAKKASLEALAKNTDVNAKIK